MHDRAKLRGTFAGLQKRAIAARTKSIAVRADAAATLEYVKRADAARRGVPYQAESETTFVSDRRSRLRH